MSNSEFKTIILRGNFDPTDNFSYGGFLTVVLDLPADFINAVLDNYGYNYSEYYGAGL